MNPELWDEDEEDEDRNIFRRMVPNVREIPTLEAPYRQKTVRELIIGAGVALVFLAVIITAIALTLTRRVSE